MEKGVSGLAARLGSSPRRAMTSALSDAALVEPPAGAADAPVGCCAGAAVFCAQPSAAATARSVTPRRTMSFSIFPPQSTRCPSGARMIGQEELCVQRIGGELALEDEGGGQVGVDHRRVRIPDDAHRVL